MNDSIIPTPQSDTPFPYLEVLNELLRRGWGLEAATLVVDHALIDRDWAEFLSSKFANR